ncbi:MAG TPA: histidine kinase, partial [Fimbriimonadaceae bacterium]|nr:histidine kinase [Fimbriimonadaceae bacterium]
MRRFDRFIGELGPGGCHAVRSSLPSRLRRRIGHSWPIVTVNSFLEDTCVLVATAYLLVRGPFERVFASPIVSGLIFGAAGASEAVFPSARFPYASHTLACACATAFVSWPAGAIAALITISAGFLLRSPQTALAMSIQVAVTVPILAVVPKATARHIALPALAAGIAQALGVLAAHGISSTQASVRSPWTLPANAFGVVLLWVVVRDAQVRAEAEVHRREVGEARRLATEAQLKALRSRVQPHFLYNALGSIAALCNSAPDRASRAVIRLGGLMRQALEADFSKPHTLAKEIEAVKGYVEIERERYGARLSVEYRIEGCEQLLVPVFGV